MAFTREFINLILCPVGEFVFVPLSCFFNTVGTAPDFLNVASSACSARVKFCRTRVRFEL